MFKRSISRRDGALIDDLVNKIVDEIFVSLPVNTRVVGLDDHVQAVVKLFRFHDETNVHVVLLWGMGGIGKTTLAQAIYHRHRKDFHAASFVKSCAEKQPWQIQEWLCKDLLRHDKDMRGDIEMGRAFLNHGLRGKKVLIVLDDMKYGFFSVENVLDPASLCPGSRILLTSRDQRVFPDENDLSPELQGDQYEVQHMDDQESWQLFCHHAFKGPFVHPDLEELAREVVKSCQGLPLALEVVGRLFSTMKRRSQWKETIKKLRSSMDKDILGRLTISYEALDEEQRQMFQEVACFMIGEYEWRAKYFWDGVGYGSETGLERLKQLCLVKVSEDRRLTMHDHLINLGRRMSQSSNVFVWNDEDLKRLLESEQSLDQIRGLATSLPCLDARVLSQMQSLQLLFLDGTKLKGNCEGLQRLKIRWLKWEHFPHEDQDQSLKIRCLECLDWLNWDKLPHERLPKEMSLKFVTVLQFRDLFPSRVTKLLSSFSFSNLKNLMELDLSKTSPWDELEMDEFVSLPEDFGSLASLERFRASGVPLNKLPSSFRHLTRLQELDIRWCRYLEELPEDFGCLKSLKVLQASSLEFTKLPSSFSRLTRLQELDISWCTNLEELPKDFGCLQSLIVLQATGLRLTKLPPSLGQLKSLRQLNIDGCKWLEELPADFGSLQSLEVLRAGGLELITKLPSSFRQLTRLRFLEISWWKRLGELPEYFGSLESLQVLRARGLRMITKLPSTLGQLRKLRTLDIRKCERLEELPEDFGCLESLEVLGAHSVKVITMLPSFLEQLTNLRKLDISSYETGVVKEILSLESLQVLRARGLEVHESS